jgi:coatomer protein complex subunit alpha (xenin)
MLNRQYGVVNFLPLKSHFISIFEATKSYLPAASLCHAAPFYLRRNPMEADRAAVLPVIAIQLHKIIAEDLQEAYKKTTAGKFADALEQFSFILHKLIFCVVGKKSESREVRRS